MGNESNPRVIDEALGREKAERLAKLNAKVPKDWKPVEALTSRPDKMLFSDRIFYWFLMIVGIGVTVTGIGIAYYVSTRLGLCVIVGGMVLFFFSTPSRAARNGYRI